METYMHAIEIYWLFEKLVGEGEKQGTRSTCDHCEGEAEKRLITLPRMGGVVVVEGTDSNEGNPNVKITKELTV